MSEKNSKKEKGQSLVEMSIGFTFLLILLGGIVDLGMMFYSYVSLRDTAQEGAIYAAYNPTDTTGIISRIQASAAYPIDASGLNLISVSCDGAACTSTNTHSCPGKPVNVQVSYRYNFVTPMMSIILGRQDWTLNAAVTETILQAQNTVINLAAQDPPQSCFP
jgi:Flp pilus assembly protein TadG